MRRRSVTTRNWLLLAGGAIAVLGGLAIVGTMLQQRAAAIGEPVSQATLSMLRVAAFAAFATVLACLPPLVLRAFVGAQTRIGNASHPVVGFLTRHETGTVRGVWAVWAVGALVAAPAMWRDIGVELDSEAAERTAQAGFDALPAGDRAAILAAAAAPDADATTPGPGTPPRDAILGAVRARLATASRFRVDHLRMASGWAFVRATEVVVGNGESQETDLTVAALLELPPGTARPEWLVREIWTLPTNDALSLEEFTRRVRARQVALRLPAALLPGDLRAPR